MDFFMETDVLCKSKTRTLLNVYAIITDNYTSDIYIYIYIYKYGATIHIDLN